MSTLGGIDTGRGIVILYSPLRLVTLTRFAAANNLEERFGESRAPAGVRTGPTTPAFSGRFFHGPRRYDAGACYGA